MKKPYISNYMEEIDFKINSDYIYDPRKQVSLKKKKNSQLLATFTEELEATDKNDIFISMDGATHTATIESSDKNEFNDFVFSTETKTLESSD